MTKSKHSKGPWSVSNGRLLRVNGGNNGQECIAGIHRLGRLLGNERTGEILSNLSLIAAAPDLLVALVRCKELLEMLEAEDGQAFTATISLVLDRARNAIANAGGTEP